MVKREVRFTQTNGVRCWRCCPRPWVESGLCTCLCHQPKLKLETAIADGAQPRMGMMAWLSTSGGTRCPQCGQFANESELGPIGGPLVDDAGRVIGHASIYGHLPGRGCNKRSDTNPQNGPKP